MGSHFWRKVLVAWLIGFTIATGWSIRDARQQAHRGQIAARALCTFKLDLVNRVSASQAFLEAHPQGLDGISGSVIRASIRAEQATVQSLSILHCKGTP